MEVYRYSDVCRNRNFLSRIFTIALLIRITVFQNAWNNEFFLGFFKAISDLTSGFRIRIDLMRIRIHHFLNCGSGSSSGYRALIIRFKKITAEIFCIYLIQKLHKGRPCYRRSLQPSKENIQPFKTWNFFTSVFFVGNFCPPGSRSSNSINAVSDPKPWTLPHALYIPVPTFTSVFTFTV
jgi:hypothetical protein